MLVAQAAAQPTTTGRSINRLAIWNGRVYGTYGDYSGDAEHPHGTGPIDVVSANLTDFEAGFISEAELHTQETWTLREGLSGRLWIPCMDPIRGPQGDITEERALSDGSLSFAYADAPGEWVVDQIVLPYVEHGEGLVETAEALFLCGSVVADGDIANGPAIWKSTDRGATWTLDFTTPGGEDGSTRIYCFFDWGDGSLSAIQSDPSSDAVAYHRAVDGDWATYDDLTIAAHPSGEISWASDAHLFSYQGTPIQLVTVAGKLAGSESNATPRLMVYGKPDVDPAVLAAAQASVPQYARDVWVSDDGQRGYVLYAGRLYRGDTDGNWTELFHFDPVLGACGLAVDEAGGKVYVSRANSTVSRFALPA